MTAREEWLRARAKGLGGSDLGAIMGLSPWGSAFSVFAEKIGLTDGVEATERMDWGNRHEETNAQWYRDTTGRDVVEFFDEEANIPKFPDADLIAFRGVDVAPIHMLVSKTSDWLMGTVDRLVYDPDKGWGVLELKCAAFGLKEWKQGPPAQYEIQLQSYLALTGLKWGSFSVQFDLYSAGHIDIERDEAMIARILEAGDDMWDRIQRNDPPEIDGSEASRLALAATLGKQTDETIALPIDAIEWDAEYVEALAEMKDAEKRKKAAANKIHAAIGDASFGALPSGVLWKAKTIAATANKREHRRYTRKEPE